MKRIGEVMMFFLLAALFAGCTEETSKGGGEEPGPGGDGSELRREVLLTLNNELVLKKATTRASGDPIATAEENAIASLDVYVFGSAEEEGTYTFQERFAYRADEEAELPAGATRLDLTATDDTKKQTKGLLKLKKGLFVKLYCIANCTTLINPETNNPVREKDFVPLTYSAPGEAGTVVANEGTPLEDSFVTFHTPLLESDRTDDLLLTPLAMSGAYTIPLDLTDFETSARVQLGFKLTRLAARFDVVNKADESRFTIREIAMGNGRKGASFFPIRIYGQTPKANAGELITYPVRPFDGADANTGTQTGAFYCYPSPLDDNGFLILKGTYQVNKTEEKEVSYQIPFIQYAADGSSTAIEINNNHRYTIGITEADDYHLDFTLTVADWADNGKIDDYTPGEDGKAAIEVRIPDAYKDETVYKEDTRTVAMYIKNENSNFDLVVRSRAPLSFQHTYAGGLAAKEYDWLVITDNSTRAALSEYTYNLSLVKGYDKKRYPKAVLRFMNLTDGTESVVFVDALAAPSLNVTNQPAGSFNAFDAVTAKATMYKTTDGKVNIQLTCPDGVTVKECPAWLTAGDPVVSGSEFTYTFTLNDRETTETTGKIVFCNTKVEEWVVEVEVELKDASIVPEFIGVDGSTGNIYTPATDATPANVDISVIESNTFTVKTATLDGVAVSFEYKEGGPEWLTCSGASPTKAVTTPNEIKFILKPGELAKGQAKKATVTLKNRSGGADFVFTITPKFVAPTLSLSSATPAQNSLDAATNTLSLYKVNNSSAQIKAGSLGGNKIIASKGVTVTGEVNSYQTDQVYTVTWDNSTTTDCSFTLANKSDETITKVVNVTILDANIVPTFVNVSGGNTYTSETKTVTMKIVDKTSFKFTTASAAGVEVESIKYEDGSLQWLESATVTKASSVANEVTLKLKDEVFSNNPTDKKALKATVTLRNKLAGSDNWSFTVNPEFQAPTLTSSSSVTMEATQNTSQVPTTTITGSCLGGSTIVGENWITYDKTSVNTMAYSYQLSLNVNTAGFPTSLPGMKTITIANKQDPNKKTTVNVSFSEAVWIANELNDYSEKYSTTEYRFATSGNWATFSVYSLFDKPTLAVTYDGTYCNSTNGGNTWLNSSSTSAPYSSTTYGNRRKYTYRVYVTSSSGTDAAYQLHKGYATLKRQNNSSTIREYTIWRGASRYGYPTGYGSPYYSAVLYGGYWWAPVNCGATKIATNTTSTTETGYLYQWGRKVTTTYGSTYTHTGPINYSDSGYEFIAVSAQPQNWRSPADHSLWGSGGSSKTSYDPCPSGWRVPTVTELNTLGSYSKSGNVITLSGSNGLNLVLPLYGLRDPSGVSKAKNEHLYLWCSTVDSQNIPRHRFDNGSGSFTTNDYSREAYAMTVRCVKLP